MDSITTLTNVHVAGVPTFFPNPTDPKKHRCMMTVIKNRGKNANQQEMTDEFTLTFWGEYAKTAAIFIDKGRCINVECVARPYTTDDGTVKANGKKNLQRTTNFAVRSFEFGGDTKKELSNRITTNIQLAKAQGLLPPDTTITADFLLNVTRPQHYDYNPALAQVSGLYGTARVWIKNADGVGGGFITPTGAAIPAGGSSIDELEAKILAMKNAQADAEKAGSKSEEVAAEIVESGAETAALVKEDTQDVFNTAE